MAPFLKGNGKGKGKKGKGKGKGGKCGDFELGRITMVFEVSTNHQTPFVGLCKSKCLS